MSRALTLCSKFSGLLPVSKRMRLPSCSTSAEKPQSFVTLLLSENASYRIVTRSLATACPDIVSMKKAAASPNSPRMTFIESLPGKIQRWALVVFADEDGGAEDGRPEAALVADGGLRDVHGADDLVGNPVNPFFLVQGQTRTQFHCHRCPEHFLRDLPALFSAAFFVLTP